MYETMLSPLALRGLTLKNRVAFAPTTMGLPPERRAERLAGVARGGVALVILGDMGVEPTFHRSGFDLVSDEGRDACRQLVARLHGEGACVSAQLFAPDYDTAGFQRLMADPATTREQLHAFMYGRVDEYVSDMPAARLEELVGRFGQAAATARALGFDMVQVHGDRLVGSLSSAVYNRRTDAFGGSSQARARFGAQVVRAVREAVGPEMPIDYKLAVRQPAHGLGKTGPAPEELPTFVAELEAAGVDCFHVTGANHSSLEDTVPSRRHPELAREGCFLNLAREVRALTDRAVCGVGKLRTPDFVEECLAAGEVQMVALSRQLLADPAWVVKAAAGRADEIRRCTWCNRRCVDALRTRQPFGCVYDD